jgi:ATP-dependent helicase/nuclease subunit A
MGFTEQQAEAIFTLQKNLVVAAGAGSGKTRVLVERYIELLNQNESWSLNSLVAITFTREAALEMRNRVREELENRLKQTDGKNERWSKLISEMDSARVDTIHGLCATILRANAAEAGIDPGFEVLDEIDRSLMLDDVISDVLQSLTDDDPDELLQLFTEYDTRSIRQALVAGELLSKSLTPAPESAKALYEAWAQKWQDGLSHCINALAQNTVLLEKLSWQPLNGFPPHDKLTDTWRLVVESQWQLFNTLDLMGTLNTIKLVADSINLRLGSWKDWGSKEILSESRKALRFIRDALRECLATIGVLDETLDMQAAANVIRWHELVARVQSAYYEAKQNASVLDFNDLEQRTAELLQRQESVRRRYQGVEFKYLLVDEFQDTNQAQWDIVRALTDPEKQTMLFVVGDLKQSIYGFRGADVSVFDGVRRLVGGSLTGKALSLSESFRSHPGLIALFNELFRRILVKDAASLVEKYQVAFDEPLTANRKQIAFDVPVELVMLPEQENTRSPEMRRWEAYEIAQKLRAMHEHGQIRDRRQDDSITRPFNYGDAAILFRSMTHVTIYEAALKAANIPYVTVAGRGYYNRQEVWDMLNLLKALHNPLDNLALASALRSPLFGFSDEMLLALRRVRTDPENNRSTPVNLWHSLETIKAGAIIDGITDERDYVRIDRAY